MCLTFLTKLFNQPRLPYPEEPKGSSLITDIGPVIEAWLKNYRVPVDYWSYWKGVKIILTTEVEYADCCSEQIRVNPYWANPGVLAHEAAHRSYSFLTEAQKQDFAEAHDQLKKTSDKIILLYSINPYGLKNQVEGHAEVYRYWGDKMPEELKVYYPKLF